MESHNQLLTTVERVIEILIARATGESPDANEYIKLRMELIQNESIRSYLPNFIISCRNLEHFWYFIKPKRRTYEQRNVYVREEFSALLNLLELNTISKAKTKDPFKEQFPIGMPFGKKKPSLAAIPYQGSQKIYFEDTEEIRVIKGNVYPDFTYSQLEACLAETKVFTLEMQQFLTQISQTASETTLFNCYANKYDMWNQEIPALIPQAWIQWHSSNKKELRANNSSYADELHRVDFVAFWKGKRFAILVDDIGHYATKNYSYWNANEERYSMRLKEDRKLRKEGWEVFRISNWEMRNEKAIQEVLDDLLDYFNQDY